MLRMRSYLTRSQLNSGVMRKTEHHAPGGFGSPALSRLPMLGMVARHFGIPLLGRDTRHPADGAIQPLDQGRRHARRRPTSGCIFPSTTIRRLPVSQPLPCQRSADSSAS